MASAKSSSLFISAVTLRRLAFVYTRSYGKWANALGNYSTASRIGFSAIAFINGFKSARSGKTGVCIVFRLGLTS